MSTSAQLVCSQLRSSVYCQCSAVARTSQPLKCLLLFRRNGPGGYMQWQLQVLDLFTQFDAGDLDNCQVKLALQPLSCWKGKKNQDPTISVAQCCHWMMQNARKKTPLPDRWNPSSFLTCEVSIVSDCQLSIRHDWWPMAHCASVASPAHAVWGTWGQEWATCHLKEKYSPC